MVGDRGPEERCVRDFMRLSATYCLNSKHRAKPRRPRGRFHLGNGARLERINWLGNAAPRGIEELLRHHGQFTSTILGSIEV